MRRSGMAGGPVRAAVAAAALTTLCVTAAGVLAARSGGATSAHAAVPPSVHSVAPAPGSGSGSGSGSASAEPAAPAAASGATSGLPGWAEVYAYAGTNQIRGAALTARPLVYVPNTTANTLEVIDPKTYRVIARYPTGREPQHVVPSWDLKTLWVNDDRGNDLIPIDPRTGRPGRRVAVADPYNLYFTPDGAHALVMAERLHRIDVRDPHTMALQRSLPVPCGGINHADYSADLSFFVATCEFSGKLVVVNRDASRVLKVIDLNAIRTPAATPHHQAMRMGGPRSGLMAGASAMPQDVRLTPDGSRFVVADMLRNGVWVIDAKKLTVHSFIPTGKGAHSVYPDRSGSRLFIANRDAGSVTVLDARSLKVLALWRLPGGGSPDMGGVSADGSTLWLSGRYNGVVYVIDTRTGRLIRRIRVDSGPHGLCVWPQPGRFSLGHTGNMR